MRRVITVVMLLWATSCFADQSSIEQWQSIIKQANDELAFSVSTTAIDDGFKLTVECDIDALELYLNTLPFEDLKLIMDYHLVLDIEHPIFVPVWAGDRDEFIEQVAGFVIDTKYVIINNVATKIYNLTAIIL